MKSQSHTFLNIIAVLIIIAALFFGYRLIFKPGAEAVDAEVGLVPAGFAPDETQESTDEFLEILLNLQRLELVSGSAFFSNPAFHTLIDFTTELQMKVPGKVNPFEPVLRPARTAIFDPGRVATGTSATNTGSATPRSQSPFPGGN